MIQSAVVQENKTRGTFDFPLEYHYIDSSHTRYQMPFHWHIEYELLYILQGSFSLRVDEETILLKPGDAALIPDGYIHGGSPQDCVYECIVFDFTRFLQESTIGKQSLLKVLTETIFHQRLLPKGGKSAAIVETVMTEMRTKKFGHELIVCGLLWQLMGTIVSETAQAQAETTNAKDWRRIDQIKKVLRRIRKDYAQNITLQDLAAEANMAPKYLCRAFREITGRTPIEYLNYYRIECAAEKITVSADPVTEIALSCGFHDLSYFSKTFKRYKGMSARDYRNSRIPPTAAEPHRQPKS